MIFSTCYKFLNCCLKIHEELFPNSTARKIAYSQLIKTEEQFESVYNDSNGQKYLVDLILKDEFTLESEFFQFIINYINNNFLEYSNSFKFSALTEHLLICWPHTVFQPIIDYAFSHPNILVRESNYFNKCIILLINSENDHFLYKILKKFITSETVMTLTQCKYGNFLIQEVLKRPWIFSRVDPPIGEEDKYPRLPDCLLISRKMWVYNLKL